MVPVRPFPHPPPPPPCETNVGSPEFSFVRARLYPGPKFESVEQIEDWNFNFNLIETSDGSDNEDRIFKSISNNIFRDFNEGPVLMKEDIFIHETEYQLFSQLNSDSVAETWSTYAREDVIGVKYEVFDHEEEGAHLGHWILRLSPKKTIYTKHPMTISRLLSLWGGMLSILGVIGALAQGCVLASCVLWRA